MHSTMMPKTAVWLLETALFPPAARPAPRLITGRWLFCARYFLLRSAWLALPAIGHRPRARRPTSGPPPVTGQTPYPSRLAKTAAGANKNGGRGPPCQVTLRTTVCKAGRAVVALHQGGPGHHAQRDQTDRRHAGDNAEKADVAKRTSRCAHIAPPSRFPTTLIVAAQSPQRPRRR